MAPGAIEVGLTENEAVGMGANSAPPVWAWAGMATVTAIAAASASERRTARDSGSARAASTAARVRSSLPPGRRQVHHDRYEASMRPMS